MQEETGIPPSKYRPSNLWAYAQCGWFDRGDISAHFVAPESAPSEAALRGTVLHALMEDDEAYDAEEEIPYDAEWAKLAKDEIHCLHKPSTAIYRETRVWTPWPEVYGTPDQFYASNGEAILIDYKFGQNAYVEKWKFQMAAYLLGVADALTCDRGTAYIIVPAHQRVYEIAFTSSALKEWRARIDQILYKARTGHPPTAREACGYCIAKRNCSVAIQAVTRLGGDLKLPDAWNDEDAKEAGHIRTLLQLARDTAEDLLVEQARRLDLAGTTPEGFGTVNQTRLACKDPIAIMRDCLFADDAKTRELLVLPFAAAKKHFGERLKEWIREGWAEEKPIRFLRRKSEGKGKTVKQ